MLAVLRSQIVNSREGPEAAIAYLRKLLSEDDVKSVAQYSLPPMAQCYALLSQYYSTTGDFDLALDMCRQATRIEPNKREWQILAAQLALQQGDLDTANRGFQGLVESGVQVAANQIAAVDLEIQRQLQLRPDNRNWAQAKQLVQSLHEKGVAPVAVGLLVAKILAASGEREKAERSILKLTEEFPKDPSPWRSLAVIRYQGGNTNGGLEAADRFKELTNQGAEAAALRAAILTEAKRSDEAIKGLKAYCSTAPADQMPKAC